MFQYITTELLFLPSCLPSLSEGLIVTACAVEIQQNAVPFKPARFYYNFYFNLFDLRTKKLFIHTDSCCLPRTNSIFIIFLSLPSQMHTRIFIYKLVSTNIYFSPVLIFKNKIHTKIYLSLF